MKTVDDKGEKYFSECFSDFICESNDLTHEVMIKELTDDGIKTAALLERVQWLVENNLEKNRLAWMNQAKARRLQIEKIIGLKKTISGASNLKNKVIEVIKESFGQDALYYAETYFQKKEYISEKDIVSLLEDILDLNILNDLDKDSDI
ncbi:hypothetical protein QUF75_13955 [Desulfococcaceae bacterium HSG7]|nr:hypothetical protein [Desulfococcaceae bacterium HSG7]